MRTRLRHLQEQLRGSLWFVPSLLSLGAVALASGMLWLDGTLAGKPLPNWLGFRAGPEAARALLTTLAGAMMGVVGVTFSITVVALTLASQQFGPRLLRNFLRDRGNQVVLGTFLATFIYSLLVLQVIERDMPEEAVPRISITGAMLLALSSLAVLIFFVHHVAHSIQADNIIAGVARELAANIDRMYPERIGEEPEEDEPASLLPPRFEEEAAAIHANESGYLQAADEDALVALAQGMDGILRVVPRPGDFVLEGAPVLLAWPAERVDDAFRERARALLIFGTTRTTEQDVEFSIDQLVEVAVRALSPGINDPFTAMRSVDRLGAALCQAAGRRFPSPYRKDEEGRLRVVAERPAFHGLVEASFNQIRQYGRSSSAVTIRLLETIEVVAGCAGRGASLRRPLRDQADRIHGAAQDAGHAPADLEDIERRYRNAVAALERAASAATNGPARPRKRA